MHLSIRRLAVASVLVIPATLGLTVATASAASKHHHHRTFVAEQSPVSVDLVGSGNDVMFNPDQDMSLIKVTGTCSSTNYNISLTNTTSHKQTIFANGENGFHLQPGQVAYLCPRLGRTSYHVASTKGSHLRVDTRPDTVDSSGTAA